ncbi:MAG: hypothetical protein R3C05_01480 [Pirellulaceae bacterium]
MMGPIAAREEMLLRPTDVDELKAARETRKRQMQGLPKGGRLPGS